MGRDKRSRSRNSSENKQEPASRSASAATAVRVPLPASSPASESVTGDSSDHEEMQTKTNANGERSPQDLENPQNLYASQVGRDPMLTDDGSLASPQIEPSLGGIVEKSTNSGAGENTQSPTNTDQSTSPDAQTSSFNLFDELERAGSDGFDEDMRGEGGDQGTSPTVHQIEGAPEAQEPHKPEYTNSGQSETIQKEKSKRLAAEERARKLKAEMEDQRERFEEQAEKAKKKHEQALQKANQAREAEKVKLEIKSKANLNLEAEVARLAKLAEGLEAQMDDLGQPTTSNDPGGDVSRQKKQVTMNEELLQAINKEITAGSETNHIAGPPMASKGEFRGGARFLLAECEFLLDKSTPVYTALRAMADYADGGREWPSEEDRTMLETFDAQLQGTIELMEDHMDRPNKCLQVLRDDWKLAMDQWSKERSEEK